MHNNKIRNQIIEILRILDEKDTTNLSNTLRSEILRFKRF